MSPRFITIKGPRSADGHAKKEPVAAVDIEQVAGSAEDRTAAEALGLTETHVGEEAEQG